MINKLQCFPFNQKTLMCKHIFLLKALSVVHKKCTDPVLISRFFFSI